MAQNQNKKIIMETPRLIIREYVQEDFEGLRDIICEVLPAPL